jgi:hypothetical protein
MWMYGGGLPGGIHKNLRHLRDIEADAEARAALAFYNIHTYAGDTITSAVTLPTHWNWWANGWTQSPAPGIPPNVSGFTASGKKSWMTETSGEQPAWLSPGGFPGDGGWSIALKMHRALTAGQQSAWLYWQLTNTQPVGVSTLTDSTLMANSPKYVAFKHFARYIRPNAQRVAAQVSGASTLNASAYVHDGNQMLTVVLVNSSAISETAVVQLPNTLASIQTLRAATSSSSSLWQESIIDVSGAAVTVTVPGYGVTTLYGATTPTTTPTAPATPTLPPCPTADVPVATPDTSGQRTFLPLLRSGGAATCQ